MVISILEIDDGEPMFLRDRRVYVLLVVYSYLRCDLTVYDYDVTT
jgi:hypothetical protein